MKRKNKLLYTLMLFFIIIVFLVIYFFGSNIEKIIYVDKLTEQPINNIRNIIKDEEPKEDDDKKNNDNKKNDEKKEENVKPNSESPIKYVYNEDLTQGNYIYLVNQFPIKDEIGRKLSGEYKTFDFKLEFKKEALGASYDITLEKMENSDVKNPWIKVYLENDGKALSQTIRNTGRVKTFDEYALHNNKDNEIIIYHGTVTENDVLNGHKNYTLRMWVSEDVIVTEEYNNKTIVARVNVYAVGK